MHVKKLQKPLQNTYRIILLFPLIILITNPLSAQKAEQKLRIAILDFKGNNTPASYPQIVRNSIERELYKKKNFVLYERSQISSVLNEQKIILQNCTTKSCAVHIGRLMSAHYVILGSVDKTAAYTVTVKLVDVKSSEIVHVDSCRFKKISMLDNSINQTAKRLVSKIEKIAPGGVYTKPEKKLFRFSFFIYGGYVLTHVPFRDLTENGFNTTISLGADNFLTKNLYLGLETGYTGLTGKGSVKFISIVPIQLRLHYSFIIKSKFFVRPFISAGGAYIHEKTEQSGAFEPLISAGLGFGFRLQKNIDIFPEIKYNAIFEKNRSLGYISFNLGAGKTF